jgi:hypothetical protein
LIITVIATGFDSAYFHQQVAELERPTALVRDASVDAAISDIDIDLNQKNSAEHFASDTNHDIWNHADKADADDDDTPAFLRRRKKNKHSDES